MTQLRALAASVGMADPDTAAAIAMAESGGLVRAVGDAGTSIGLWQIHMPTAPARWRDRSTLMLAGHNAEAANEISRNGTYWQPWTTFRDGSYRKYLPEPE